MSLQGELRANARAQSIASTTRQLFSPAPKMPVPAPSTTEKVTTADKSSATAVQTGKEVEKPSTQSMASSNDAHKDEAELAAERLYEERIEEEYAKREGGA